MSNDNEPAKQSGCEDFEKAFQLMRSAVWLCVKLAEAANLDPKADEATVWKGMDAIIEEASRDVKSVWKRRYTVVTPAGQFKSLLRSKLEAAPINGE